VGNDKCRVDQGGRQNVQAILYEEMTTMNGRSETFTAMTSNLNDLQFGGNVVSSVKVQWAPPATSGPYSAIASQRQLTQWGN